MNLPAFVPANSFLPSHPRLHPCLQAQHAPVRRRPYRVAIRSRAPAPPPTDDSSDAPKGSDPFSGFAAGPSSASPSRSISKKGGKVKPDQSSTESKKAVRALGTTPAAPKEDLFKSKTAQDFIAEGVVDDVEEVEEFDSLDIRFGIDNLKDPFKEDEVKRQEAQQQEVVDSVGQAVDVTGDAGVMKRLISPGSGQRVSPGATVNVEYTGKLPDGSVFDSTSTREGGFSFELGSGAVIKGWESAVSTMTMGEVAEFTISPSYAYGRRGMPPVIPGNSTLTFQIEVVEAIGGESDQSIKDVPDFNPDVPRTPQDIAANYEVLKETQRERRKGMSLLERIYIISPFMSQTGEKPPWWINPNITFVLIAICTAVGFYFVVLSGAIHIGYVDDSAVNVNIFK